MKPLFNFRTVRLSIVPFTVAALVLAAAGCGGGGKQDGQDTSAAFGTPSTSGSGLSAVVISSDVALGKNRFLAGLLEDGQPVTGAEAQFGFFKLNGDQGEMRYETGATTVEMTKAITIENPGGTRKMVEAGETAAYVAEVEFDETGDWGLRATWTRDGVSFGPINIRFTVTDTPGSVAIGSLAPRSVQRTLDDVADLSEIDSSALPDPEWHTMTIAEAVTSGRPTAIAFTTAAFCRTQMCAPMMQELARLYDAYKDRVNFIHVEPYELDKARSGEGLVPIGVMSEWGIHTEPWIWVVDAGGVVTAKFEAFVTSDEIEAALKSVLGESNGPVTPKP